MTCVRNGTGPTWSSGAPMWPAEAARSAAETPDDSIPLRPPTASTRATTSTVPTSSATSVSNARRDDLSTTSGFTQLWTTLAFVGLMIGVASALLCARMHKSRPPTVSQGSYPEQAVPPPPKPTHTSAPLTPSPRPTSPEPASSQPYGSPIEHHVECVTIGQSNTHIEVPLQPLTSSNPYAYPQPLVAPIESPPSATLQMPTPHRMPLNGSTLHSQLSSSSLYPPHPSPADPAPSLVGPAGLRVEIETGPGDAELALPGGQHPDAELALPGGYQHGARIQVHGNLEDDELVLPGLAAMGDVAQK
ncbi:hypothetical protein BCR44DRAFT_1496047 [Catenaria anguillulae PL171]|uniref:Uncharacterized protein n=1 Tax=Catenaria anguillulae PL171 TaxID=765915 RepID=A0A1Y2I0T5_9FUNG|nr:hypothetical protein BCR44DRAFT_1496047 [Catenaria anguillulae PL171]